MSSSARGNATSAIEISNISAAGVCLLAHDEELFMAYEHFPWFKDQAVGAILNVEEPSPGHFYWPDLDVDLTRDRILHPEKYPLVARSR